MENLTTFTRDWRVTLGTLAMAILIATLAAPPARAEEYQYHVRHRRAHPQRHYRHGHYHRGVIYAPPPVVYVPPPPPGGFTFIFPFTIH